MYAGSPGDPSNTWVVPKPAQKQPFHSIFSLVAPLRSTFHTLWSRPFEVDLPYPLDFPSAFLFLCAWPHYPIPLFQPVALCLSFVSLLTFMVGKFAVGTDPLLPQASGLFRLGCSQGVLISVPVWQQLMHTRIVQCCCGGYRAAMPQAVPEGRLLDERAYRWTFQMMLAPA